jgi:hypothetical protein
MKTFEVKRKAEAFSIESVLLLREMAFDIFEKYKRSVKNLPRPIMAFDMLERARDRFEISLSDEVKKEFLFQLCRNKWYRKAEKKLILYLNKHYGDHNIDVGLLPVAGGNPPGPWHRDAHFYDSFSESSKAFYFTILVYLDEGAGTEFLLGSSVSRSDVVSDFKTLKMKPKSGDLVFFDGRTIHRGLENSIESQRIAIYITYTAKDYVDEEAHLPMLHELLNRKAS